MARPEGYLGSDAFALAPFTNRVAYLEDGDVAVVRGPAHHDLRCCRTGPPSARSSDFTVGVRSMVDKGGQRHFMAKEIDEQPEVIGHTLSHYIDASGPVGAPASRPVLRSLPRRLRA